LSILVAPLVFSHVYLLCSLINYWHHYGREVHYLQPCTVFSWCHFIIPNKGKIYIDVLSCRECGWY
jgi:hypothetical protein